MKIVSIKEVKVRRYDSMPDIDIDFEGLRRDDVKRYMEQKYSTENVCSVGTYNRMKGKSAVKDFVRIAGANFQEANAITKEFFEKPTDPLTWKGMFKQGANNEKIKKFINKYPDVFENIKSILLQPRSASVHPSAVIITPDKDEEGNKMRVWDWLPVKKDPEKGVIISEWEGKYMDIAGFLKEDILGIAQLDKFRYIIDLIEKNRNHKVDFSKIPIDDEKTYDYFKRGWNEDVFQFGTGGLKSYCSKAKPDNIEDLIAINALYRPGPMASKAHESFVKIRSGKEKPDYDKGMKVVTANTAGLYIYQEQVMQGMVVGGLSLVESDNVRTAIKKFDKEKLGMFQEKFVNGYTEITGNEKESIKVWDKMMAFSAYGFNKSHAAAYSLMGYWSQYLKANFPLEFWTASLNYCKFEEETPNRISEINLTKEDIYVKPPDINKSEYKIVCDPNNNSIYYSLISIKFVGEIASQKIIDERQKNGEFFSLEEFYQRVDKSKVNKKIVTNLILAGCFDEICFGFDTNVANRLHIIEEYYSLIKQPVPEEYKTPEAKKDLFWKMKQKELTGLGKVDYKKSAIDKGVSQSLLKKYVDMDEFLESPKYNIEICFGCRVSFIVKKYSETAKQDYWTVNLETNSQTIRLIIWGEVLDRNRNGEKLEKSLKDKSFLLINGYSNNFGSNLSISDGTMDRNLENEKFKIIEL